MSKATNSGKINGLCVITDRRIQTRFTHEKLAEMAIRGGAEVIQLREKELSTEALVGLTLRVKEVCQRFQVPLILNDRVDVALITHPDGVHLGKTDLPIAAARHILPPKMIIGATASTVADAIEAEAAGADYIGFGHLFPTTTKEKNTPPVSLSELTTLSKMLSIPVMGIGGISRSTIDSVIEAGAKSIAVVSAVVLAEDPEHAARELADCFKRG